MDKHLQYVLLISSTKNQTKTKEITKDGDFTVCVRCAWCLKESTAKLFPNVRERNDERRIRRTEKFTYTFHH